MVYAMENNSLRSLFIQNLINHNLVILFQDWIHFKDLVVIRYMSRILFQFSTYEESVVHHIANIPIKQGLISNFANPARFIRLDVFRTYGNLVLTSVTFALSFMTEDVIDKLMELLNIE